MRRLLFKAVVFSGITAMCVLGINRLALQAGRIYKDGASIICEEKRNAVRSGQVLAQADRENVLFIGHSTILAGIVPQQFDEAMGGKTYSWNFSLPALPIGPHYFLLKDHLRHNRPPQLIVLKLTVDSGDQPGLFDNYAIQGAAFDEIWSYGLTRSNKSVVWNHFLPMRLYSTQAAAYLRSRLREPQEIEMTRNHNRAIVQQMLNDRGYYYIREQAYGDGRLPDDYRAPSDGGPEPEVNLERDPYVRRFFDLVQCQGIRVLLIETPLRQGQTPQRIAMPSWYRHLLAQYDNVRMADQGWRLKFYENRLFSDPTHLNPEGAARFTREVRDEMVETFGSLQASP